MTQEEFESIPLSNFFKSIKLGLDSQYYGYLREYTAYADFYSLDDLVKKNPEKTQRSLENYAVELATLNTRSVLNSKFNALFLFFRSNNVELDEQKIRKFFLTTNGLIKGIAYTEEEVKKIFNAIDQTEILVWTKPRTKALIHFLAASGCEFDPVPRVRVGDVIPFKNCYMVKFFADELSEYITFLTPEASKALREYLEITIKAYRNKGGLPLNNQLFDLDDNALSLTLTRLVKKAKVTRRLKGGTRITPVVYGFRKRYYDILQQKIDSDILDLLMGNIKNKTKSTTEKLFLEYSKVIDELTVFKDVDIYNK